VKPAHHASPRLSRRASSAVTTASASPRRGRRKLRNLLYMPLMGAATQHNPVLKAYYQRLRAKGKEAKVALVACMRKLIVILNTMLARDQTWNPPARAAA